MKKEIVFVLLSLGSLGDVSVVLFHYREIAIAISIIILFVIYLWYIKKMNHEKQEEIFQLNQKWEDFFQKYKARHEE